MALIWRFAAVLLILLSAPALAADAEVETVPTTWRLLDYVAVDYRGAVKGGQVLSQPEYGEMLEFTAAVDRHLHELPRNKALPGLISASSALQAAVKNKEEPDVIASRARRLGADLVEAFPVPMAPTRTPDLDRGASLFHERCSSCHGAAGDGNGPDARGLNPPPIAFTDRNRAAQRSVFALEQVITQGLDGTKMKSFRNLPADDRWALAMHVSRISSFPDEVSAGETAWKSDPSLRKLVPNLQTLVSLTPAALGAQIGDQDKAFAVLAYLRSNPAALKVSSAGGLSLTRERLKQSVGAYRQGNASEAARLALSGYLDGFEPVEPTLAARDARLMSDIEAGMGKLRAGIGAGAPVAAIEQQARDLDGLFARAEVALSDDKGTKLSTFLSSLTVLVREGLEAMLVVVAMIAFLRKAERKDVLPYVHAGWAAALLAGAATWLAATTLISISGAGRELTEGFGGIFAAIVLVSVGIWMHGKARADVWQRYITEKLDKALSRKSTWFLFLLSFVVVYREVFETILFFAAMWGPGRADAVLGGAATGAIILGGMAWAMLRYSGKLPITTFFRYSSLLMAVLAVVLAGKGVAALQEAGMIGITRLEAVPQIELIGLYPTAQVVAAQVLALVALAVGFRMSGRKVPRAARNQRLGN